jgi:hypothetical protein
VVFFIGRLAYFMVAFLVVLPLLKRFLERKYNVKIHLAHASLGVTGGTPMQRFVIQLLMLAYIVVVAGLGILALFLQIR